MTASGWGGRRYFVLGASYTGAWPDTATLVITILDPTAASPPPIGAVIGGLKPTAGLTGVPPLTAPSAAAGLPMTGAFGPANVRFTALVASPPPPGAGAATGGFYATGATIDLMFNQPTNKAFLPDSSITPAQLASVFSFSRRPPPPPSLPFSSPPKRAPGRPQLPQQA